MSLTMPQISWKRRIHPVADKLGIHRRLVTFQVLRRTVGADLQFYGTLKDAQAALRHKSAGTTANVYMQPVSQSLRAALNVRTKAVFAASLSSGSGDQKNLENSALTPNRHRKRQTLAFPIPSRGPFCL
jgi:hypothetical protein